MVNKYVILTPCFNESLIVSRFLDEIEGKVAHIASSFVIVVVDDASNDGTIEILRNYEFKSKNLELKVIKLQFNMGHQEAIRQGLIYCKALIKNITGVIVMDSDGEDNPAALTELIKLKDFEIVFVERGKRKESFTFKLGYYFYRLLFKAVTGKSISFGNYSLISEKVLSAIVNQKFIHYASFLSKQKFRVQKRQFDRQKRINGNSKMSYKTLVFHGLYSLIEYAEEILFSLMKLFFIILVTLGLLGCFVLYSKFISHKAIYGWTSSIMINLSISALIIISTIIIGLLLLSIKKTINQGNGQYYEVR